MMVDWIFSLNNFVLIAEIVFEYLQKIKAKYIAVKRLAIKN